MALNVTTISIIILSIMTLSMADFVPETSYLFRNLFWDLIIVLSFSQEVLISPTLIYTFCGIKLWFINTSYEKLKTIIKSQKRFLKIYFVEMIDILCQNWLFQKKMISNERGELNLGNRKRILLIFTIWRKIWNGFKFPLRKRHKIKWALPDGTTRFKKCKQLFEYQHLLLLRGIWWSKF